MKILRYTALLAVTALILVGCSKTEHPVGHSKTESSEPTHQVATKPMSEAEHAHKPGSHGGMIIPIGSDSYHAEAVVEKDGTFRLLMLGADESRIQEVEIQPVKAYIKIEGESDATPIDMKAEPQEGDAEGKTSQFVAKVPESAIGTPINVTIPNLRIAGERFRIGFTTSAPEHEGAGHDSGMPAAVSGSEEKNLYFTPGGKYTAADIQANGKLTAGQKFRGFMSKHDMSPKPGDFICPVTFTKANPKIEWTIDGKKYLFCCPPCVDEYVRLAKVEPEAVKPPEEFIQGQPKDSTTNDAVTSDSDDVTVSISKLTSEDQANAKAQKYCAVMSDNLLGSMGVPYKLEVEGKTVYLCCKGCRTSALSDPKDTLATVDRLRAENVSK